MTMLPVGTRVYVRMYGYDRPYKVVKWGKHKKKWLMYEGHLDEFYLRTAEPFLQIKEGMQICLR